MRCLVVGRLPRLVPALVAVSWGMALSGPLPVAAQEPVAPVDEPATDEPAVTVTPSTGLHDGDVVQVELTGFAGLVWVAQCHASIQDGGIQLSEVLGCGPRSDVRFANVTTSPAEVPRGLPIREWVGASRSHCAARPGACLVVAIGGGRVAVAPIEVVPGPLTVRPTTGVAGTTVTTHVGGEPESEVTVAQCVSPVGESLGASRCGPGTPLTLDEHGVGTADVVLAQSVGTPAGTVSCVGPARCAIATFDATGNRLAAQDLTVTATDPIGVTVVSPSSLRGLDDGQEIELEVRGRSEIPVTVAQCDRDVAPFANVEDGPCQVLAELGPAGPGTDVRTARVAIHHQPTLADGTSVHCLVPDGTACSLVVEADDGGDFQVLGLSFATVEVSPSSGLLDGQAMNVEGRGLGWLTSAGYGELRPVHCQGLELLLLGTVLPTATLDRDRCEDPATAPVASLTAQGTLSITFPAAQRFQAASGTDRYCRDDCQVALSIYPHGSDLVIVASSYSMAEGALSVSPSSGLEDGQPVTVTGSQLMPSYDGPPVWFLGSGRWSLLQCQAAAAGQPTLLRLFQGCAPLGPGSVPVTGPELSLDVDVQAEPTAILGEGIDCMTGPGACVVMLARLEQDGSLSAHTAPISFR
jgi:hypothetical protein